MKKEQIIHVVVIVLTAVIGYYLAANLNQKRIKIEPEAKSISKTPLAGFHKFASDVEWMRFINYCGSQKTVDAKNVEEHLRRVEKIIALDPNFEKSYTVGVQFLAIQNPDKAVELLAKACNNEYLKKNWKIPFYAGFILSHHYKDDSRIGEVVEFYEKAVKRAGQPEQYLINALLRAKAKKALLEGKGEFINPEHAMLHVLYREWKKNASANNDMAQGGDLSAIPDLTDKLLVTIQKAKERSKDNPAVMALIDKIRKDVLASKHLCDRCLSPYKAGDSFCTKCGNNVKIYGVCAKCGAVLEGEFCGKCGTKAQ